MGEAEAMEHLHPLFVGVSYGVSALALVALITWILLDQRARKRDLSELDEAGIRRRSAGTNA
jgi:heme exporter protein D